MEPGIDGKVALALSLVLLMTLPGTSFLGTADTATGASPPARAGFGQHPLTQGTVIYIHDGGKVVNDSYYIPVEKGSMVSSIDLTVSPTSSQEDPALYPVDATFKIGSKLDYEYISISDDGTDLGSWGRQTSNMTGAEYYRVDTRSSQGPFKMVLPAGAEITRMVMDVEGFQRKDPFVMGEVDGGTNGDRMGHAMVDIGDIGLGQGETIIVSAPDNNTNTGSLYRIYYLNGYVKEDMAICPIQFSDYGASISEKYKVSSSIEYVMVGAPTGAKGQEGAVYLYNIKNTYKATSEDQINGLATGDLFGTSVCVGDLDADGWKEMIVGAPGVDSGAGAVYVLEYDTATHNFSGKTSLKCTIKVTSAETGFGRLVSCGDFNFDGKDDLAAASDEKVRIFIGSSSFDTKSDLTIDPIKDGPLDRFSFMDFIGTTTSTGADTLAIGSPSSRRVLLYDASSTPDSVMDKSLSSPTLPNFGYSISNSYDYDGDGALEFAIGSPGEGTTSQVQIFTRSGSETTLTDTRSGAMFGASVLMGIDMRGDSFTDMCAGAEFESGITPYGIGRAVIMEYYDLSTLPSNRPKVMVGSNPIWEYSNEHLTGKVSTGDISSNVKDLIASLPKEGTLMTDFNEYVVLPLSLTIPPTPVTPESTNLFNISNIVIVYDHPISIDGLADKINEEIDNLQVSPDGLYHVPVKFGSTRGGGVIVQKLSMTLDLAPIFKGYPKYLSIKEDTCMDIMDLSLYASDDVTPKDDIEFQLLQDPRNATYVNLTLQKGHILRADAFNDTSPTVSNDNWTGKVYPIIRVIDESGLRTIIDDIEIDVVQVNDPPALKDVPDTTWVEDRIWMYSPVQFDAEGDELDPIKATTLPPGMSLQYDGRTYVWNTNNSAVGDNYLNLTLSDGKDERRYSFVIAVENVNDAPFFAKVPPAYNEIFTDETFRFDIDAVDIDPGDTLTYQLEEGESADLDPNNGSFIFTPKRFYSSPVRFKVKATDGSFETAVCTFSVGTIQRLYPPSVTSEPQTTLYDMVPWSYTLTVLDLNGDIPSLSLVSGPAGMEFDVFRNMLEWGPGIGQVGEHAVVMMVNSSGFSIYYNFTLNVERSVRIWDMELKTPVDGMKVKGKVRIVGNVNVTPGIVRNVQMRIDGSEWRNISLFEDAFSYDLDTTKYSDGTRTIEIRAYDGYEYSPVSDIEMVFANDEGKRSLFFYVIIALAIIVAIAALVLGGFMAMKYMKRREEENEKARKLDEIRKSKAEMDAFLAQNVGSAAFEPGPVKMAEIEAMDLDDIIKRTGQTMEEPTIPTMKAGACKEYQLSEEITPQDEFIEVESEEEAGPPC